MSNLIPEGDYAAKIIDYKMSESKNGFPQIIIQFKETTTGWEKWMFASLKEGKAFDITMENLRVLGLEKDKVDLLVHGYGHGALDEESEHRIRIKHETYEGKTRDVVSILSPIKAKSMSAGLQKTIMNAMKADMLANAGTTSKRPAKKDDDSELPF